ncbi:MAG: choice-of-anchor tandem repeat GloVer-containing protein, partial [Candidatus Korobacteraceae bacterium]
MSHQLRKTDFQLNFRAAARAVAILFVLNVATMAVQAQTYQVIHNFTGGLDGANPWAGLTIDVGGNLYGVAGGGGNGSCAFYGTSGCGTAFKLTSKNGTWVFAPLYSFHGGSDGEFPVAAMTIGSNGSLYGTTAGGGQGTCTFNPSTGCGTVFNLKPTPTRPPTPLTPWLENLLYPFTGGGDGANPNVGNLIFDQAGNLYGTATFGGASGLGVVFELSPSNGGWTETVLYSFAGGNDGNSPYSGLVFDKAGNLYGTTSYGGGPGCGGTGCGTVYELTPSGSGWSERIIYSFQGTSDGAQADGGLIFDQSGNLYGGTYNGGSGGGGTIYELTPSNGGWNFNVLYSFLGTQWGLANRLTMDAAGNLYGTTQYGGANQDGNVFELSPSGSSWTYTDLHDFTYGSDGGVPVGTLVVDASGHLYGTAFGGGANPCSGGYGCGVVFEITPSLGSQNFTVSAAPSSLTILQGNQGTSTITTTISGGFSGAITLSASGAPSGTTVSFNPDPIPAPGAGTSTMTITVGSSTPVGTYPITVTGNGGGIQQNTTVTLTVISPTAWAIGFDFRNTSNFVTDPAGDTYVLSTTAYPTTFNGVNFGWTNTNLVQARDRSNQIDPRLAGVNFAVNGSPATFYVDLPASGTYNLSLALGDAGYASCSVQCQIQFLDGGSVLATITEGPENTAYFYDAQGNNWSAANWPNKNLDLAVAIAGTRLTMIVAASQYNGDYTPIAFLG